MPRLTYKKQTDIQLRVDGLLPLTRHYFYLNGRQVTSMVKQLGKKLGQPLLSDANGSLTIIYYFSTGIPSDSPTSLHAIVSNSIAGVDRYVVTNLNETVLPSGYESASVSHGAITINSAQK